MIYFHKPDDDSVLISEYTTDHNKLRMDASYFSFKDEQGREWPFLGAYVLMGPWDFESQPSLHLQSFLMNSLTYPTAEYLAFDHRRNSVHEPQYSLESWNGIRRVVRGVKFMLGANPEALRILVRATKYKYDSMNLIENAKSKLFWGVVPFQTGMLGMNIYGIILSQFSYHFARFGDLDLAEGSVLRALKNYVPNSVRP